jgi:hypothetical protein
LRAGKGEREESNSTSLDTGTPHSLREDESGSSNSVTFGGYSLAMGGRVDWARSVWSLSHA